ncbi:Uncharacterised protein [Klebsiella pneumoniae]|nr:Uncharacterised protein [Klebsiella pneumoniae]
MRELSEYVKLVDYAIANCWHKKLDTFPFG